MSDSIGSIPDWLSAVGTISATVTALYLARQQTKVRINVSTHVWGTNETEDDSGPTPMRGVDIVITNSGYQPFSVNLVCFSIGLFRSLAFEVRGDPDAPKGVKLILHGESMRLTYSIQELRDIIAQIRKRSNPYRFFGTSHVKIQVLLSTGELLKFSVENNVKKYLLSRVAPSDIGVLRNSKRPPKYHKHMTRTESI